MAESTTRASSRKAAKAQPRKEGLNPGDYVTNPLKPEWGPGRVVELKRDVVFVFFRDRPGKEVIRMKQSGLNPTEPDPELEAIPGFVEKNGGYAIERVKRAAKGTTKKPVIKFAEPVEDIDLGEPPEDLEMLDDSEE